MRASAARSSASISAALGARLRPAARSRSRTRRASRRPPHSRVPAYRASPRRTSSCSLVSSRPIAASRAPKPAARSASVAAMRGPLSNSTSVAGMRDELGDARLRARPALAGRNPSKKNRSVGSPATVSAIRTADAPGAAVTGWPAAAAARTSGSPDRRSAAFRHRTPARPRSPAASFSQDFRPRRLGVVVVIGDQRRRQAVMIEQLARDARVLAGHEIGGGENFQRRAA